MYMQMVSSLGLVTKQPADNCKSCPSHPVVHDLDAYSTRDYPSLQPSPIEDNLFVSSAFTEAEYEVLLKHGITHILQVGYELEPTHPEEFVYECIGLADRFDDDIVECLPLAFSFISEGMQHGKVLVHCAYGQSRSAAVVIGYLMWRDSKPYHQCLQHVQACRPLAGPNAGFEMQLCFFKELGFDFNRWPGWNAATFLAIRQQQLVLLQQQKQVVDEREDLQDYKHNLLAAKHGLQLHKQHKRSEGSECSQQQSEQQDLDSRADTERSLPRTLPQPICCTIM